MSLSTVLQRLCLVVLDRGSLHVEHNVHYVTPMPSIGIFTFTDSHYGRAGSATGAYVFRTSAALAKLSFRGRAG